jgi:hypothetical protein
VESSVRLDQEHDFVPGRTNFESDRQFSLWAYTVSNSQLLFRSRTEGGSRIDLLFKPVDAMKVRCDYHGLVVRCASDDQRRRVLAGVALSGGRPRVLALHGGPDLDYVVAAAVGWLEDNGDERDPSRLAGFAPATDSTHVLPA